MGRVLRGRYVIIRARPAIGVAKSGFVVSSTVAKKATDRNLVKRRLRDAVQKLLPQLRSEIIVYATRAAVGASYDQLNNDLRQTLLLPPTTHASPSHRRH